MSKQEFWQWFWTIFCCIIWFIAGFLSNTLYINYIKSFSSLNKNVNITQNCSNLSLLDTSRCLQMEVLPFFVYNMSNMDYSYSEDRLRKEGGVCWQYANYYEQRLKKIGGFYSTHVIIFSGNKISDRHEFLIMSSEEGYCILDQQNRWCNNFAKNNNSILLQEVNK